MSGPRITAFMTSLRKRGVRMETDGQSLRLTTADGLLPEELRAAIVERKAEVIAFMVQAQRSRDDTAIQPADGNAPLPLSFAQLRIWILDQMKIGTA